jgi:multicomponent Na+:H+ antiporter subunit E
MKRKTVYSLSRRFLLFLILWVFLGGTTWRDPVIAAIGIVAATLFSLSLWPPASLKLRWIRLPGLAAPFFWSSLKGAIDIAYRAVAPSMPLLPALIQIECRLPNEAGVVLFTWMISLMPGTASVDLKEGRYLTVHVADSRMYGEENLRRLEKRISEFIQE